VAQTTDEVTICAPLSKSKVRSPGRLRELDGWRAISVFLVIIHHVFSDQHPDWILRFHLVWHIAGMAGLLGVDTFFVISGFVICRLLVLEESRYGSVSLKGFYYRRIFRILPPLYIYLAGFTFLLLTGRIVALWSSLAIAAAFLSDVNGLPMNWFLGHTWSLAVEEQFYLIFPATWLLSRPRWRGLVFSFVFALCVIWNVHLAAVKPELPLFDAKTRAGFACICFGVVMAIHEEHIRRICSRVSGWVIVLVAFALVIHPVSHESMSDAIFSALFMPPAIGLILMYTLERESWLRAALCRQPLQAIGLTSYGIYLWQQLCTSPLDSYPRVGALAPFLPLCVCFIVPASYFWVEKPATRFAKKLSGDLRRPKQHAQWLSVP
jgi:peptidoglycan/LPS O-acetylase OafA/YrhL